ncbi:MAG: C69 family dipeptidase [Cyclobacteriaceae bacterium]|nr:C69 family dipeptidase [Cyclobacteriaceae bacterium]
MCDTFIALSPVTASRHTILGKNSDREPDEAQAIVRVPRSRYAERETLRCTYIEIPQASETFECILSKPFQMWGAEMGVNEWGVAIGNEAVFTRARKPKRNDGLTGMDLLRLALERSRSAEEALRVITSLLEAYGQDACGGYRNRSFFYDNSFIIADPSEAWVLETVDREWAARKVEETASISNRLTLSSADRYSHQAMTLAKQHGWWDGHAPFDFAASYSDKLYTWLGRGAQRQACTLSACNQHKGHLTAAIAQEILQTHNLDDLRFTPGKATTGSICMHRTSILNPSDTTGSMVAELRKSGVHTVWLTGTPHPCLSVFVPFFLGTSAIDRVEPPSARPDNSLWWQARQLHTWIGRDYRARKARIQEGRLALQKAFESRESALMKSGPTPDLMREVSERCLEEVQIALKEWVSGIKVGA